VTRNQLANPAFHSFAPKSVYLKLLSDRASEYFFSAFSTFSRKPSRQPEWQRRSSIAEFAKTIEHAERLANMVVEFELSPEISGSNATATFSPMRGLGRKVAFVENLRKHCFLDDIDCFQFAKISGARRSFPLPLRRGRIETKKRSCGSFSQRLSPAPTGGGGLKPLNVLLVVVPKQPFPHAP
jgi:hypothetical protein